ncbi:glycosyltransferase family 4 protein [Arenibaculum pallidiluteum]|uniref:glycosyltransferase family 4 protein n=1 Tax=Arenibaculum pallidiluteum TaxID=2812559 RepID=UPI001A96B9CC|nr:glycosyltransferase family 4 protein [Arenibaculum pallidiluteum]
MSGELAGVPARRLDVVCLITHMDQGGAQEAILRLARQLRARGHRAEVWFLYQKDAHYAAEPHTRVLLPRARPGVSGYARIAVRLVSALARRRPDAVVSFLPLANVLGQVAARLTGVRCRIASQRNPGWTYEPAMQRADRIVGSLGFYTGNVVNSRAVRQSFDSHPAAYRRRISLVYNGIEWAGSDLDPGQARARFDLPAAPPLALVLGRLCDQKNQAVAVEALTATPDAVLVLAGDGEDRDELAALARARGVSDRVVFLGKVARQEVPHLLRAVDIFVQPSRYEGQSNALLEALNEGLPVIASRIPPQVETLGEPGEQPAGILVDLDDGPGWAAALSALCADPGRRAELGARAKARARAFTVERMAEGFEKTLLDHVPAVPAQTAVA